MAFYQLPKIIGKDQKPPFGARINWDHHLSRGLIGAWLFNEGGGIQAVNAYNRDSGSTYGTTLWNPEGCYFNGGVNGLGNTNYINVGHSPIYDLGAIFTVAWSFRMVTYPDNTNGGYRFIIGKDTNTGRSYNFGYKYTAANDIALFSQINGTDLFGSIKHFTDYNFHSVAMSQSDLLRYYIDGNFDFSGSGVTPVTTATDLTLGKRLYPSYNDSCDAICKYIYIYNRSLSADEIYSLHVNPYQMFWHPIWDTYIIPAAAPPPTGGKSIFGYDSIFHAGGIIQT